MKKIRIIWGTEAVRKIEKTIKGYTDKTYTFKTENELNAFLNNRSCSSSTESTLYIEASLSLFEPLVHPQ